jgi:hypothetical protein
MLRSNQGTVRKVVVFGLCAATVFAFGSVWGQPRPSRIRPTPDTAEDDNPPFKGRPSPYRSDPTGDEESFPSQPQRVRTYPPGPVYGPYSPNDFGPGQPVEADQFMAEVVDLTNLYRQAKDDKARSGLRTKLLGVLSKKFDSQHQRREKEIAALKARLKELTELQEKRGLDRKGIIERHTDFLLREIDGLGWEQDQPQFMTEFPPTSG